MFTPRWRVWTAFAAVLLIVITLLSPQKLEVSLYKLSLITLAGVLGYWLDRVAFPYSRPDSYLVRGNWERAKDSGLCEASDDAADYPVVQGYQSIFIGAMIRRALVMLACVLGVAMGL